MRYTMTDKIVPPYMDHLTRRQSRHIQGGMEGLRINQEDDFLSAREGSRRRGMRSSDSRTSRTVSRRTPRHLERQEDFYSDDGEFSDTEEPPYSEIDQQSFERSAGNLRTTNRRPDQPRNKNDKCYGTKSINEIRQSEERLHLRLPILQGVTPESGETQLAIRQTREPPTVLSNALRREREGTLRTRRIVEQDDDTSHVTY